MARKGVNVIHAQCDPELVNDRSLPYTAYLVEYESNGQVCYDIAAGSKMVEVFDHYWDCLLYTSPSPRDGLLSRMPSSA